MPKTVYMEKLCVHLKLPMIKLVDGASGGGSITTYREQNGTYLPDLNDLLHWLVSSSIFHAKPDSSLIQGRGMSLTSGYPSVLQLLVQYVFNLLTVAPLEI